MKRLKLAVLAVIALAAAVVPVYGASADGHAEAEASYTVTITNLMGANYLTPPNWAAHEDTTRVFRRSRPASPGVQGVAENGDIHGLEAELIAAIDDAGLGVSGIAPTGPLGPGASVSFDISTSAERFSMVAMVICSNDGFAGVDSYGLPAAEGQTRVVQVKAFDAGTEINTEMREDFVPAPFCGEGPGSGMSNPALAENGVIRPHKTLQGTGDIDPALDWTGPVAELTITRNFAPADYTVEIENLTGTQYLTPTNWAFHDSSVRIFQRMHPASAALQGVAENGDAPGMAAYLMSTIDDAGHGVSGVAPGGVLAPGASTSFHVTTDAQWFSAVAMVICTNDGFAGADSRELPRNSGFSRTYYVQAFDAGTEINTEMREDFVPAPFCGEGGGTGMTNPALAENGVVRIHPTLQGIGDIDPALDWSGPVMKVTITRD